jgi:hypothetical protein
MPFPANWFEELIAEWLELDGFLTLITPRIPGLKQIPDVVGAKVLAGGQVEIRHCEAKLFFADGPKKAVAQYQGKFSPQVEQAVRDELDRFLRTSLMGAVYDRWIICIEVGQPVRAAFLAGLPSHRLLTFREFLADVRATIASWKAARQIPGAELPALPDDKWLLKLLDYMDYIQVWVPSSS